MRPEDPLAAGEISAGDGWGNFFIAVVMVLLTSFAAIFWHRNILLDEDVAPALPFRADAIFWRFMGYTLLLVLLLGSAILIVFALLFALPMFVPGMAKDVMSYGWPAFVPLLLVILFIMARAGLAFPAAAIGNKGFGLAASWRATRGNSYRILLLHGFSAVLTVLAGLAWTLASSAIADAAGNIPYTVSYLANGIYQLLFVLLGVGLLSLSYGWLVEEKDMTGL